MTQTVSTRFVLTLIAFTLIGIGFLMMGWAPGDDGPVTVETYTIARESEEIKVNVDIPVIKGMDNQEIQERMNQLMSADLTSFVAEIEAEYPEYLEYSREYGFDPLRFEAHAEFEVTLNQAGILSIPVVTYQFIGGAHGMTIMPTYNFDLASGDTFSLQDLLDDQQFELVNQAVKQRLVTESELFFEEEVAGFQSVAPDQPFYLTEDALIVYYDVYELGPGVLGIPEFPIPLADLSLTGETIRTVLSGR